MTHLATVRVGPVHHGSAKSVAETGMSDTIKNSPKKMLVITRTITKENALHDGRSYISRELVEKLFFSMRQTLAYIDRSKDSNILISTENERY